MTPLDASLDANRALARRWLDLVSRHDVEAICALTSPTWTIEDVIAEGDRVVVRAVDHCVQDAFLGIPAAGRTQTFTATFTFRIADAKVQATWRNADDLGRVLQLGARLVPP